MKNTPSESLPALMGEPRTPPVLSVTDLCQLLGVSRRNWSNTFKGKRVTNAAAAHGWTEAKARELGLTGAGRYLVRREYRESLWRSGVTARGRVWAGHKGTGMPAVVADLSEWRATSGARIEPQTSARPQYSEVA